MLYLDHGKEVSTMSKRKKKSGKAQPDTLMNLVAALLNLITALLLLWEKLSG